MKLVPLTQGKFAMVDDEDFERVSKIKWHASWHIWTWYARGTVSKKKRMYLHQFIMGYHVGDQIDHINNNGLDCQKGNMRKSTPSQNTSNQAKRKTNTSGFKGVSWNKSRSKWQVSITVNYRQINLGRFSDKLTAALAYDEAARKYHGEFARTNF